jgi:hypothetical protein
LKYLRQYVLGSVSRILREDSELDVKREVQHLQYLNTLLLFLSKLLAGSEACPEVRYRLLYYTHTYTSHTHRSLMLLS